MQSIRLQVERQEQWHNLPPQAKEQVKTCLLQGLGSSDADAAHTSAIAISVIGTLEITSERSSWPALLPVLQKGAQEAHGVQRVAALDSIGYLCEEISNDGLEGKVSQDDTNSLLSAIVNNVGAAQVEYTRPATNALYNMLTFVGENMETQGERDALVRCILHAAQQQDAQVRTRGMQCMARLAEIYYEHLQPYMKDLFETSLAGIKAADKSVVNQALDMWCTIAEREEELVANKEEGNMNYIGAAIPLLAPELQRLATEKPEFEEDMADSPSSLAVTLVGLSTLLVGDRMIEHFMPFVNTSVQSEDWRTKDAGLQLFAALMEGTSEGAMGELIKGALPFVCRTMLEAKEQFVAASAAWLLSVIILHKLEVVPAAMMNDIMSSLVTAVGRPPAVAIFAASAINHFATGRVQTEREDLPTLDSYAGQVVKVLIERSGADDADENDLRTALFAAVGAVVEGAGDESLPMLRQLMDWVMQRLEAANSHPKTTPAERDEQQQWQYCMITVLFFLIVKLEGEVAGQGDRIMGDLLTVLQQGSPRAEEEVWNAIGQVANAMGPGFERYLEAVVPLLLKALATDDEEQQCKQAMSTVQDLFNSISTATAEQLAPRVMEIALNHLKSNVVPRALKPAAIDVIGTVACTCGPGFHSYLHATMPILQQAAAVARETEMVDEEMAEITYELRIALLGAFSALVVSLIDTEHPGSQSPVQAYAPAFLEFVSHMATDEDADEQTLLSAGSLLSDVVCNFPQARAVVMQQPILVGLAQKFGELARESGSNTHLETYTQLAQALS